MRVHIGHHFYGAGNMGDDLMLAGFLQALPANAVDLKFSCCSPFDIVSQRQRFPQIEWLPYSPEVRQTAIANSDCWLGLGDTPFQSDSGEWFIDHLADEALWCKQHQLPMWFLGVGVNNREVFDLPQTKFLLDCVEGIWSRDVISANCIADYFPLSKIRLGADLANIYLRHRAKNLNYIAREMSIGLCLHFEDRAMFDIPMLEIAILNVPDRDFAWLIQEVRMLDFSEHCLYDMFSDQIKQRLEIREPHYAQASIEELLNIWGRPDVAVSSRYHAGLIQAWSGGRIALVARNQKLRGLAEQLDCPIIESVMEQGQLDTALDIAVQIEPQRLFTLAELAESSVLEWLEAARCIAKNSQAPSLTNKHTE
jgi:hypothetical protein